MILNENILNNALDNNGVYSGPPSWIYYLIGAVFLVLSIICLIVAYRWRHSKKEAENYNYSYNEFVRFWQLNKFTFMVCLCIVLFICSIIFFLMNDFFLKNSSSNNQQFIISLLFS